MTNAHTSQPTRQAALQATSQPTRQAALQATSQPTGQATPSKPQSVTLRVPATSANLGMGFDCLGMALNLYASFCITRREKLQITGCEQRFCNERNLVWTSFTTALTELGRAIFPVHIHIDSDIPLSGGLGSSSTCIVAGVTAAFCLSGLTCDTHDILEIAQRIEGHPDNVAPAIFGGLISCFTTPASSSECGTTFTVHPTSFKVHPSIYCITIAPPYEVRTSDARRVLPQMLPLCDVVWQMGRLLASVEALKTGDLARFAQAHDDKIHEPYRKKLIPDYDAIRKLALDAGAASLIISGSGSTMIALVSGKKNAQQVYDACKKAYPNFWIRLLQCSDSGLEIL